MRNRERIRQMKAYVPVEERQETISARPSGEIIDPLLAKYSRFSEQYPVVGIHLKALNQLQKKTKNAELSDNEREALLVHSLWSEDPDITAEIAKSVGFNERRMNASIDAATYELESFSDTLLGIVSDLRKESLAKTPNTPVLDTVPVVPKVIIPVSTVEVQITPAAADIKPHEPKVEPLVVNQAPTSRTPLPEQEPEFPEQRPSQEKRNYDHPILTKDQELALFGHLKKKAPVEVLMQDDSFLATFEPEERAKLEVIAAGSRDIEEVIISCYTRLVDVIARSFKNLPLQDALNAGNIGLIKSARRWKIKEEAKFSTYAVWGIRASIASEAFEQRSSIKIPSYVQQDLGVANKVRGAFQEVFDREPSSEELKQQLLANTDLTTSRVDNVIRVIQTKVQHVGSINEQLSPDGDGEAEKGDFIADKTVDVEAVALERVGISELQREIKRALAENLTEEEGAITAMMYGIGGRMEKDAREIAQAWGLATEDVEDIHRRSLSKLHRDNRLREHWAEEPPSFVYRMSAERAAFKLGLFRGLKIERVEPPVPALKESIVIEASPSKAAAQPLEASPKIVPELEKRNPHIEAITNLDAYHILVITPEPGETLDELRSVFSEAAEEAGRQVRITIGDKNSLILRVEEPEAKKSARSSDNMQKVKELRLQGLTDKEISDQLGITPGTVRTYASTLAKNGELEPRPRGRRKTRLESPEQPKEKTRKEGTIIFKVKELRNQGLGNQEIAEKLGVSYGVVAGCAVRLLKTGEITALKASGLEVKDDDTVLSEARKRVGKDTIVVTDGNTRDRVKDLRNQGYFNDEIALMLGVSRGTVGVYASRLLSAGEIERHKRGARGARNKARKEASVSDETKKVKEVLDAMPKYTYKDGFKRIFEGRRGGPKGRREESAQFDSQVLDLIKQGFTRKKSGEKLGVPITTIDASITRMVSLGEYTPGRSTTSEAVKKRGEYNEIQEKIQGMLEKGLDIIQIADAIDYTVQHVKIIAWRLTRNEKVQVDPKQLKIPTGYIDKRAGIPAGTLSEVYAKVAELRQQGLSNTEVARKLELPKHRVEVYASNLIRAGVIEPSTSGGRKGQEVGVIDPHTVIPKTREYQEIAKLRNEGLNNREIAAQMGKAESSVSQIASKLIRAGQVTPLRRGKAPSTGRTATTYDQITVLRQQGIGNKEIAEKLKLPIILVNNIAHELVQKGVIERLRGGKKKKANTSAAKEFSKEDAFSGRQIYREAISDLNKQQELLVQLEEGDSLDQVRGDLRAAAAEVGVKVRVRKIREDAFILRIA